MSLSDCAAPALASHLSEYRAALRERGIYKGPKLVIWDITYACPLRCGHCYSESGRRPSKQLDRTGLFKVLDAIIALRPLGVSFSGGEPLLVRELPELIARLRDAKIEVAVYTSGWQMTQPLAQSLVETATNISVSIDGESKPVHDHIRGRSGSFDKAIAALEALGDCAMKIDRETRARVGVDCTLVNSNFARQSAFLDRFSRVPGLDFVSFGAAAPSGLASGEWYCTEELLSFQQLESLDDPSGTAALQASAPPSIRVLRNSNLRLQMSPERVLQGQALLAMQVEPDGAVRAMPIYEGTVGNLQTEDAKVLWARAVDRWSEPFVYETLSNLTCMTDWARATRAIDRHYGGDAFSARLNARKVSLGSHSFKPIP